jgi:Bacterial Ig-like domain
LNAGTTSRRRSRRSFAGRLEQLETRTLLNATIDVDAAGRLTYRTDPGSPSTLRVSEIGGVYTFAVGVADAPISVTGNAAGLAVAGDGTRAVAVTGPSSLQIDATTASSSILLASARVPTGVALYAGDVQVTVGDQADPRGLSALPAGVAVAGSPQFANNRLVLDDRGLDPGSGGPTSGGTYFEVWSDRVRVRTELRSVFQYSSVSSLTLKTAASLSNASNDVVYSTADGVDTLFDLSASRNSHDVRIDETSAAPNSRLTILGSQYSTVTDVRSLSSPLTFQATPGSQQNRLYANLAGMSAGWSIDYTGGGNLDTVVIAARNVFVSAADFHAGPSGAVVFTPSSSQGGFVKASKVGSITVDHPAMPSPVVTSKTLVSTGAWLSGVVAEFTSPPGRFFATIIWGDGEASSGSVDNDPADPNHFYVQGSHTYARPGSYTPGVIVTGYFDPQTFTVGNTPIVLEYGESLGFSQNSLNVGVNVQYSNDLGNGETAVNNAQPVFYGVVSDPNAHVEVYATPRGGSPILIGRSDVTNGSEWSVTPSIPLADGLYTIQVQAFNDANHTSSSLVTMGTKLIIDTVRPRIVGVQFLPRRGQVVISYRDYGGVDNAGVGIDLTAATYAPSYSFAMLSSPLRGRRVPTSWQATKVVASPVRGSAPQKVTITLNNGRPIPRGLYQLTIKSPNGSPFIPPPLFPVKVDYYVLGVIDRAGNPLDSKGSGGLPAGDRNDFIVQLNSLHGRGVVSLPKLASASKGT